MYEWVQVGGLIVIPAIALIGLFYYVRATIEQAEATQKPCVVLRSTLRDPQDAVLEMGGTSGDLIIHAVEGLAALRNIGTGPAVNVFYLFEQVGGKEHILLKPSGTVQTLASHECLPTHVSRTIFPAHVFDCTITYESLSRRRYQTRISVNNDVLGAFKFGRVGAFARVGGWVRGRRLRRKSQRFESVA